MDGVFSANGLVGIDVSDGSVTGLTITNNLVQNNRDAGIGFIDGKDVLVQGNTVLNNGRFGIEVKNSLGDGSLVGPHRVVVMGNVVSRDLPATDPRDYAGIVVMRRSPAAGNPDQPGGVVVISNTLSGYRRQVDGTGDGCGIVAAGLSNTLQGNTVTASDIGIQVQGANPAINAQGTPFFDRDNAAAGGATLVGNRVVGNDVGVRVVRKTVVLASGNLISGSAVAGVVLTGTDEMTVTLSGAPADFNTFRDNGPGGTANVVAAPAGQPSVNAFWNDWGALTLRQIEDSIYHLADDAGLRPVDYFTLTVGASPDTAVANGLDPIAVTAGVTGFYGLDAASVIAFDTSIGVLSAPTATAGTPMWLTSALTGNGVVTATAGGLTASVAVTFTPLPEVAFSDPVYSVAEVAGPALVTLTLSAPQRAPVSVVATSSDGTASALSDYAAVNDTLTFAVGQTMLTFTVPVSDDALYERDEAFWLALNGAVNATLTGTNPAPLTIVDDESQPVVAFSAAAYGGVENAGPALVTVTLSGASAFPVTVTYAFLDGAAGALSRYASVNGVLVFAPGVTVLTLTVPASDDAVYEGDETAILILSGAVNGTLAGTNLVTLTIVDDESQPVVAFSAAAYSSLEDAGPALVTVTLSGQTAVTATVQYTAANGTAMAPLDYAAATGVLTFAPGVSALSFNVAIVDDSLPELDETVLLLLGGATNATLGAPADATLTILRDSGDKYKVWLAHVRNE